jgi:DNA-binding MurR/RpiR family transcriptional regulator
MIGLITQPTIIVGTSGIVKYLKSLGFETFPELFDESYDDIVETNKRLVKVMNEVERVCKIPESALKDIYKDLLSKVVHNQNKIFEYDTITDWYNLLESITDAEMI